MFKVSIQSILLALITLNLLLTSIDIAYQIKPTEVKSKEKPKAIESINPHQNLSSNLTIKSARNKNSYSNWTNSRNELVLNRVLPGSNINYLSDLTNFHNKRKHRAWIPGTPLKRWKQDDIAINPHRRIRSVLRGRYSLRRPFIIVNISKDENISHENEVGKQVNPQDVLQELRQTRNSYGGTNYLTPFFTTRKLLEEPQKQVDAAQSTTEGSKEFDECLELFSLSPNDTDLDLPYPETTSAPDVYPAIRTTLGAGNFSTTSTTAKTTSTTTSSTKGSTIDFDYPEVERTTCIVIGTVKPRRTNEAVVQCPFCQKRLNLNIQAGKASQDSTPNTTEATTEIPTAYPVLDSADERIKHLMRQASKNGKFSEQTCSKLRSAVVLGTGKFKQLWDSIFKTTDGPKLVKPVRRDRRPKPSPRRKHPGGHRGSHSEHRKLNRTSDDEYDW